jgi:hypothetical protein
LIFFKFDFNFDTKDLSCLEYFDVVFVKELDTEQETGVGAAGHDHFPDGRTWRNTDLDTVFECDIRQS